MLGLDDDREKASKHVASKGWTNTENVRVSQEAVKPYSFSGIRIVYIVDHRGKIAAVGHELNIPKNIDLLLR